MKYLSFWGLDNKFPPKYSPYFVFKAISFKILITSPFPIDKYEYPRHARIIFLLPDDLISTGKSGSRVDI